MLVMNCEKDRKSRCQDANRTPGSVTYTISTYYDYGRSHTYQPTGSIISSICTPVRHKARSRDTNDLSPMTVTRNL